MNWKKVEQKRKVFNQGYLQDSLNKDKTSKMITAKQVGLIRSLAPEMPKETLNQLDIKSASKLINDLLYTKKNYNKIIDKEFKQSMVRDRS